MTARMLYVRALSPIHSGTGQAAGVIDLPVARERVTGWPYLPGSSVKGVLRDACDSDRDGGAARDGYGSAAREAVPANDFYAAFGPPTEYASAHAGDLWFTDLRLLCFPVRSLRGSFAWVTCPMALQRWARDLQATDGAKATAGETAGATTPAGGGQGGAANGGGGQGSEATIDGTGVPDVPRYERVLLPKLQLPLESAIKCDLPDGNGRRRDAVVFEDLDLGVNESEPAERIGAAIADRVFAGDATWQRLFRERFAIVHDDLFGSLAETATEVRARVRLEDERKTVAPGALWYEEAVPEGTIFAGPVVVRPDKAAEATKYWTVLAAGIGAPYLQIGGNASIGRGLVEIAVHPALPPANGSTGGGPTGAGQAPTEPTGVGRTGAPAAGDGR